MADAVHYRILEAVKTVVVGLGLPGIAADSVHTRKVPTDRDLVLPAVVITPWEAEKFMPGAFTQIWRQYPALVTFVKGDNQDYTLGEPELSWREAFLDHVERNAGLPGVGEVWNRTIDPRPAIVDLDLWKHRNLFGGSVLVWYWITKTR